MSSLNLSLFDAPADFRSVLGARLRRLSARGIHLGTSSWKYAGWLGQIYTRERYLTRGRFSEKKFEGECLAEYAETFPAVCGDFSFYQFPSPSYWQRLFGSAGAALRFGFKVPEEITVREWPKHARYGARGGGVNPSYLDAELLRRAFLAPLEPYAAQVGVLIFEFGTLPKRHYENTEAFTNALARFLDALPAGWRFAVEIRNREYFEERYFDVLRARNVAHVFSSWTRMPALVEQARAGAAFTADFMVARALLKPGRGYEQAVALFQPYEHIQEPNPAAREGLKELIERAKQTSQTTFIFVNNRLEGNAPATIAAVTEDD